MQQLLKTYRCDHEFGNVRTIRNHAGTVRSFIEQFGKYECRNGPLFGYDGTLYSYHTGMPIARWVVPNCGGRPALAVSTRRVNTSVTTKTKHIAAVRKYCLSLHLFVNRAAFVCDNVARMDRDTLLQSFLFSPEGVNDGNSNFNRCLTSYACTLGWAGAGCPNPAECGMRVWIEWWKENDMRVPGMLDRERARFDSQMDLLADNLTEGWDVPTNDCDCVIAAERAANWAWSRAERDPGRPVYW